MVRFFQNTATVKAMPGCSPEWCSLDRKGGAFFQQGLEAGHPNLRQ
jgi:hypothetical protein